MMQRETGSVTPSMARFLKNQDLNMTFPSRPLVSAAIRAFMTMACGRKAHSAACGRPQADRLQLLALRGCT